MRYHFWLWLGRWKHEVSKPHVLSSTWSLQAVPFRENLDSHWRVCVQALHGCVACDFLHATKASDAFGGWTAERCKGKLDYRLVELVVLKSLNVLGVLGWNVAFDRKKTLSDFGIKRMTNYRDHLISFFDFYRTFEFGSNVICPFLGRAVPIKSYSSDLEDFAKFMDNVKGFNKQVVNVADLFNLNYNVAYGVGKRRISKFVPFCAHAMNLLQNELKVENGLSLQLDSLNIWWVRLTISKWFHFQQNIKNKNVLFQNCNFWFSKNILI